jgi:Fe-S-cluster containining protein
MNCRKGCGACCIGPSISSPIPGMPHGKPAGVKCIHLTSEYLCGLFDSPLRPKVCGNFMAEDIFCGNTRSEALFIFSQLEY